jgi:uncharacterized protein (TIGR00369 family)
MTTDLDPLLFGPDQRCFGCGPHNDVGMKLRFRREDDQVHTTFHAKEGWEGPPGILHGGLQATLADEIGAWTVVGLKNRFGLTTSMNLRYYRPARIGEPIEASGRIVSDDGKIVTVAVTLRQDGKRLLSGKISYSLPDVALAERIFGMRLPPSWRALAGEVPEAP